MTVPIMSSDSFFHQLTVSRWICYFLLWWEVSWCSAWAFHFIQTASNCREYRLLCSRGRFFFPFSKLYRDCYRHYDDNPIMANVSSPAVISFSTSTIISRWWLWSFAAVYYRGGHRFSLDPHVTKKQLEIYSFCRLTFAMREIHNKVFVCGQNSSFVQQDFYAAWVSALKRKLSSHLQVDHECQKLYSN